MDRREAAALDRHITGNYGEDQFPDDFEPHDICQQAGCVEEAEDGVLCVAHQQHDEEGCGVTHCDECGGGPLRNGYGHMRDCPSYDEGPRP